MESLKIRLIRICVKHQKILMGVGTFVFLLVIFVFRVEIVKVAYKSSSVLKAYDIYILHQKQKELDRTSQGKFAYYSLDDSRIIYYNDFLGRRKLPDADFRTFEVLARTADVLYARDKNRVYFKFREIDSADPATFRIANLLSNITQDKDNVYLGTRIIGESNTTLLVPYPDSPNITHDDVLVYNSNGEIFKGIDSLSFRKINDYYYTDNKNLIFIDEQLFLIKPISGDIQTFANESVLRYKSYYVKDQNYVYYQGKIISSDPNSFKFIDAENNYNSIYAKDSKFVYLDDNIIEAADPLSFEILKVKNSNSSNTLNSGIYSKDKNYVFHYTKILDNVSPYSVEYLGCEYIKASNQVYFHGMLDESIDPYTFKVTGCYSSC